MEAAMIDARAGRSRPWPLPLILAWMVWRRHRRGLCVVSGVMATAALLAHTLLSDLFGPLIGFWTAASMFRAYDIQIDYMVLAVAFLLTHVVVLACVVYVAGAAALVIPDPLVKQGAYPRLLLRSPARSSGLALWPTIFAMVAAATVWVFSALAILRPMGFDAPLLEPAVVLALLAGCAATTSWAPASPEAQGLLFLGVGTVLVACVILCFHVGLALSAVASFAAGAGILLAAVGGLEKSRTGVIYGANLRLPISGRSTVGPIETRIILPSAVEAVRRTEYNGTRATIFKMLTLCIASIVMSTFLFLGNDQNYGRTGLSGLLEQNLWMYALQFVFLSVCLFGACAFIQMRATSLYVQSRPMSTALLTAARMRTGLYCASEYLLAGLLLFGGILLYQNISVYHHFAFVEALQTTDGNRLYWWSAFFTLLTILTVYRLAIDFYSVSLSGNTALMLATIICDLPVVVIVFVSELYVPAIMLEYIAPWVIAFAQIKALTGLLVIFLGLRLKALPSRDFVRAAAVWVVLAEVLWYVAPLLLPADDLPPNLLAAIVCLAMPLVRLSAGPLLLDRNRHR